MKHNPDRISPSAKGGGGLRKFGKAKSKGIGSGMGQGKSGALVTSPAKDALLSKRGK